MMIEREHLAGPAHAGLDLVDDQHDAVLVADAAQLFNKRRRCRNVAAFALNDLENDARDFFGRRRRLEQTLLDPFDARRA